MNIFFEPSCNIYILHSFIHFIHSSDHNIFNFISFWKIKNLKRQDRKVLLYLRTVNTQGDIISYNISKVFLIYISLSLFFLLFFSFILVGGWGEGFIYLVFYTYTYCTYCMVTIEKKGVCVV